MIGSQKLCGIVKNDKNESDEKKERNKINKLFLLGSSKLFYFFIYKNRII